jgi:hypothetical protein
MRRRTRNPAAVKIWYCSRALLELGVSRVDHYSDWLSSLQSVNRGARFMDEPYWKLP